MYLTKQIDVIPLLLSIGVAFLGSYATISVYEQFRLSSKNNRPKLLNIPSLLVLDSVCLGGVTIWAMHFIGMSAVVLINPATNQIVPVRFQIAETIGSLLVVLVLAYAGLYISSLNKIFTKDNSDAIEDFIHGAKNMSIQQIRHMKGKREVFYSMLTVGWSSLLIGGTLGATGVCVMHYVGMVGVAFSGHIEWDAGIVLASVLIALIAATAAFWLLFRLMSLFPHLELLRLIIACIMTVAVCGMHYAGMAAASYVYDPAINSNSANERSSIDQSTAFFSALTSAIIVVSLVFLLVIADLRSWYFNLSGIMSALDVVADKIREENKNEASDGFLHTYLDIRYNALDKEHAKHIVKTRNSVISSSKSHNNGPSGKEVFIHYNNDEFSSSKHKSLHRTHIPAGPDVIFAFTMKKSDMESYIEDRNENSEELMISAEYNVRNKDDQNNRIV